MKFYTGMHLPAHAHVLARAFVSWSVLKRRRSDFAVNEWVLDSGAFTQLDRHHDYTEPPEVYAAAIHRWSSCGKLDAAVTQDYMCEPFMLAKTGKTVAEHQRLTIERYDAIHAELQRLGCTTYLMPVLQGYQPHEYVSHIRQYGERLGYGAWVGVGSVCKRNGNPDAIAAVLLAIKAERPDLRLHGFGVKTTSLRSKLITELLHSADSMAWSFAARREGFQQGIKPSPANDPRKAVQFAVEIERVTATREHAYQWRFEL
jgi:hypothetical protein